MSKPYFFKECTNLESSFRYTIFTGDWHYTCKLLNDPCDESKCKLMNGKKNKEEIKPQKSGIVVIDQGLIQTITSRSGA